MQATTLQSASVWRLIVILFTAIIGLAALAFPDYLQELLYVLVAGLVGAVILWQYLRIRELEAENASLPQTQMPPPPPPASGWEDVVNAKLVLEDREWKATGSFRVEAGKTVRVTAFAQKRFILHLATDVLDDAPVRKRSFHSVERNPEAMQVTRTFKVAKAGTYAIVLVPTGVSSFRAEVKVERETEPVVPSW